jgi:hypothetical protein
VEPLLLQDAQRQEQGAPLPERLQELSERSPEREEPRTMLPLQAAPEQEF